MKNVESILLIEDCPEIQEVLKLILEHEGYRVCIAGTGAEALTHLSSTQLFSLIFLDVTLPDMNAFEFLQIVRDSKLDEGVPIILCSAVSGLQKMNLPQGVVGTLPKPFQIEELSLTLKNYCKKSTLSQDIPDLTEFNDLIFSKPSVPYASNTELH